MIYILKILQGLTKNISSNTEGNFYSRCLNHKASLWFPHPTQFKWGTLCLRKCFNLPFSPQFIFVVSMHANHALDRSIKLSSKQFSKDFILLAPNRNVLTNFVKEYAPIKRFFIRLRLNQIYLYQQIYNITILFANELE